MGKKSKNNAKTNKGRKHTEKVQKEQRRGRGQRRFNDLQWKSEKYRLKQKVGKYGMDIKEISGDGNCLFRAISDQMYGDESMHDSLRADAVEYIKSNKLDFEPFIEDDEPFDNYIKRMKKSGVWGGNIELQALSMCLGVNIKIHSLDCPIWEISNFSGAATIHLSYHDGDHYNSIRLKGNLTNEKPLPIPESLQSTISTEENEEFELITVKEYLDDIYQQTFDQKILESSLKKNYGKIPEFEIVEQDSAKIIDEYYREAENFKSNKIEEKKSSSKSQPLAQGKRPAKVPRNNEICWCGSGKKYKKCCKATDQFREVEEEKIIRNMDSLQI